MCSTPTKDRAQEQSQVKSSQSCQRVLLLRMRSPPTPEISMDHSMEGLAPAIAMHSFIMSRERLGQMMMFHHVNAHPPCRFIRSRERLAQHKGCSVNAFNNMFNPVQHVGRTTQVMVCESLAWEGEGASLHHQIKPSLMHSAWRLLLERQGWQAIGMVAYLASTSWHCDLARTSASDRCLWHQCNIMML